MNKSVLLFLFILFSCSEDLNVTKNVPKDFIDTITVCKDVSYKSIRKGDKIFEKEELIVCEYYDSGLVMSELHYNTNYVLEYEVFYSWDSDFVSITSIDWNFKGDSYRGWIESEKKLKWNFR